MMEGRGRKVVKWFISSDWGLGPQINTEQTDRTVSKHHYTHTGVHIHPPHTDVHIHTPHTDVHKHLHAGSHQHIHSHTYTFLHQTIKDSREMASGTSLQQAQ